MFQSDERNHSPPPELAGHTLSPVPDKSPRHEADRDDTPAVVMPLVENNHSQVERRAFDASSPNLSNPSSSTTTSSVGVNYLTLKRQRGILAVSLTILFAISFRFVNRDLPRGEMPRTVTKKLVDVNSPPVDLPQGETIVHLQEALNQHQHEVRLQENAILEQQQQESPQQQVLPESPQRYVNPLFTNDHGSTISRSASETIQDKPIPVIVDRGEIIPAGVGTKKLSAADALMCRQSVINYVINATNGKDECLGLQKAFDETCSQDPDENTALPPEDPTFQDQNDIWLGQASGGAGGGIIGGGRQRGRRRRLLTKKMQQRQRRRKYGIYRELDFIVAFLEDLYRYFQAVWELFPMNSKPMIRVEDEVFRVYHKTRRQEIQRLMRRKRRGRRKVIEAETDTIRNAEAGNADDDDVNDDDDDLVANANTTAAEANNPEKLLEIPVRAKPSKPHNLLNLPTGQSHVSGKTLEKTLMLQHEDEVLSNLKRAAANTTNVTTSETVDPRADAAKSAKAVADTSNLISAVLNDPSSIEARACCASILNVYHENCNTDAEEEMSDKRLFIVVLIMAFCGMVKSLIRHFKIRWLPEAAGCILVGVMSGYLSSYFPHQDFSFDGNWFLRILVPPIVFEAALSIDKKSFNRHIVPIIIYSTAGTLLATVLTASIVYNGTKWLGFLCETIPYIESLIFGSLISSIDPIAVLSVLSNMGMTDTDTLYVLVFGESLLNDGVAIVLFHTLVQFLDSSVVIDSETITAAVVHFFVVALGSVLVGVGSGILCTLYYWGFHGCQTPLVEVLMFLCWALLPYYVCDGIGWSGIVSAVTVGFVMDMYVIGANDGADDQSEHSHGSHVEDEKKFAERARSRLIFSGEGHLSVEARTHIGFVTEIVATMMETAIFAYLGLFLFSHRYHWNAWHVIVSILACCISRAIMIPLLSSLANWITSMQKYQNRCRGINKNSATGVIVDRKMQMVLWFAGLRGAMSFALVEHIPLFDAVTGEGTRMKAELKAMTSASILFTVFVLGGLTNYFMDYIGLSPTSNKKGVADMEMIQLTISNDMLNGTMSQDSTWGQDAATTKTRKTRQRIWQKQEDPGI